LTAEKKDTPGIGLGQCVPEITIGEVQDVDFCSKWSLSNGGMSEWVLIRDPKKLLLTKQFYSKKNAQLLNNPYLHRLAIYQGFKTEAVSHLLEDLLWISAAKHAHGQRITDAQQKLIN